jgi:hypothetical protein
MATVRPSTAPQQRDKGEVNVQVLVRCRCDSARTLSCHTASSRPDLARRPNSSDEVKQRVPQVVKCNDAAREVRSCPCVASRRWQCGVLD